MRLDDDILDLIDGVAKALAHPLRLRILALLEERVASPSDLVADGIDASIPLVAYHVRALHRTGLVELVSTRQRRGALEHYYRAAPAPVIVPGTWERLPRVVRSAVTSAALERIAAGVERAAREGAFERSQSRVCRRPLVLDEGGFEELSAKLDGLTADVERIVAEARTRLEAAGDGQEVHAEAVLMLYEGSLVVDSPSA